MMRTTLVGVMGMVMAMATPAQADFGFSFGYNDRPVYRTCAPVVRYTSCEPVYYSSCAPVYTSYAPVYRAPVRYVAPRTYCAPAPRRSVNVSYYHRSDDRPRRFGYLGVRGERGRSARFIYRR